MFGNTDMLRVCKHGQCMCVSAHYRCIVEVLPYMSKYIFCKRDECGIYVHDIRHTATISIISSYIEGSHDNLSSFTMSGTIYIYCSE